MNKMKRYESFEMGSEYRTPAVTVIELSAETTVCIAGSTIENNADTQDFDDETTWTW